MSETKSFPICEEDERKIKEIIFKNEKRLGFDSQQDYVGPLLVPHLLDFLRGEITNLYHYVERNRHVLESEEGTDKQAKKHADDTVAESKTPSENVNYNFTPNLKCNNSNKGHVQRISPSFMSKVLESPQNNVLQFGNNLNIRRDNTKSKNKSEQPVSKINYHRKGQHHLKNKSDQLIIKSQPPPDLFDENAFPSLGSVAITEVKKRVKPNPLSLGGTTSAFSFKGDLTAAHSNNVAFTSAPIEERPSTEVGYKDVREQLRAFQEETKNFGQNGNDNNKSFELTPSKAYNETYTIPDPQKVSNQEKLDEIAKVYALCIGSNCIPNLATEFYFICQLLTMKIPLKVNEEAENTDVEATILFQSQHNCVYFAVSILEMCPIFLSMLKPTSLRMILEMTHIPQFSPHLFDFVENILLEKTKSHNSNLFNCQESVEEGAYQEEIDSRENFSSAKTFQAYRKQRDSFKKLLREWETHSHKTDWLHGSSFKNEVRTMCFENSFHMSGLFMKELEAHCMLDDIGDDVEEEFLMKLEGAKLKKLQKRMKSSVNTFEDPNVNIVFQDSEGFFRDFILFNNSISLYQHLLDKLSTKVTELNNFPFNSSEPQDNSKKSKFFLRIKCLRLYAKFLGFVYFLPYRSDEMPPTNIAVELKKIRSPQTPILNVDKFLTDGLKNKSLTLVIPWVVEYLGNMDKLAPSLPEYEIIFQKLVYIYRYSIPSVQNPNSCLLLKLCLGKLFESFSQRLFFKEYQSSVDKTLNSKIWAKGDKLVSGIDNSYLVDDKLMHLCCPNIGASEHLIKNFFLGKVKALRKIKPYAVEEKMQNFGFITEVSYLQRQLEANFFHINPPALKEIVEFSAERAVTKTKESFQSNLLPEIKKNVLDLVNYENMRGSKNLIEKEINLAVGHFHSEIWLKVPEFVKTLCDEICLKIILVSSSDLTSANVVEMAVKIASRIATDRVFQFIQTYTSNDILRSELKEAIKAWGKQNHLIYKLNALKIEATPTEVQEMDYSIIKVLEDLRSYTFSLLSKEEPSIVFIELFKNVESCKISDEYLSKSLKYTVADWYFTTLLYKPDFLNFNMCERMFSFFNQFEIKPTNLVNLVCPRNLELLKKAPQKLVSWKKMEYTIIQLLNRGWLSRQQFEGQCLTVLKLNWPENLLKYFASFIGTVVESEKRSSKLLDEDFLQIMEWLSWFCEEPYFG